MDRPEPAMPALTMELAPGSRIRNQSRRVLDLGIDERTVLSVPEPRFYKDSADCKNV
jgi:hypothetical protein